MIALQALAVRGLRAAREWKRGLWAPLLVMASCATATAPRAPIDPQAQCLAAPTGTFEAAALSDADKRAVCRALESMPDLDGHLVDTIAHGVTPPSTLMRDRAFVMLTGPSVAQGTVGARCELLRGDETQLWRVSSCDRTLDGARLENIDVDAASAALTVVKGDMRFAFGKKIVVARVNGDVSADVLVVVDNGSNALLIDETIVYVKGDRIVRTKAVKSTRL